METVGQNLQNQKLKQYDYLRCQAVFTDKEKLLEAIDLIKSHPKCKLIRIKNMMDILGKVEINYWYDQTCVGAT